jgi:hypothetical protein
LDSLRRGLLGKSVINLLKRQRALSASPFERNTSPSRKREASSRGEGDWAKVGLCMKNRKRRARINFHPLFLWVIDANNIINLW